MSSICYQPGDLRYKRIENTSYDKRRIANFPLTGSIYGSAVSLGHPAYNMPYTNQKETFTVRMVAGPRKIDYKGLITPDKLEGNKVQVDFYLELYSKRIIRRLSREPFGLFDISQEIRQKLTEYGYQLPYIETFQQLNSFSELMDLLFSLARDKEKFSFDLFSAAIIQYSERCR